MNHLQDEAGDHVVLPEPSNDLGAEDSDSDNDERESRDRFRSSTQDNSSVTAMSSSQTDIPDTLGVVIFLQGTFFYKKKKIIIL